MKTLIQNQKNKKAEKVLLSILYLIHHLGLDNFK